MLNSFGYSFEFDIRIFKFDLFAFGTYLLTCTHRLVRKFGSRKVGKFGKSSVLCQTYNQ